MVLEPGQQVPVSLEGANADSAPYCYGPGLSPGIWFDVVGDGTKMEFAVCEIDGYQPNAKIYCGDCELPACVSSQYAEQCTFPNPPCPENCLQRKWTWCSKAGEVYHVQLVDHALSSYMVSAQSSGNACADFVDCVYDPPPTNDNCADAIPIEGEGIFPFENTYATPEEPYDMCHYTGTYPPTHDVWYCWTSPCDGYVTVETCGLTTVDTQLAVYPGCDCQDTQDLNCNNDECGYQSRLDFIAKAGQSYRIQVGTRIDLGGGSGQFRVSCGLEPAVGAPCANRAFGECLARGQENALNSTRGQYVVADNFTAKESVGASQICWWGGNFDGEKSCVRESPDDFRVTYYADYCGKPWGLVGGPYSQSAGT
jgi:hypothetical protein